MRGRTAHLKSRSPRHRVCANRSGETIKLVFGTLCLAAGALTLRTSDALARFDQKAGVRLKYWFRKKLGDSALNRELWSVGTTTGLRSSTIGIRVARTIFLVVGMLLLGLSLHRHFR
jgi:hypothetical protein